METKRAARAACRLRASVRRDGERTRLAAHLHPVGSAMTAAVNCTCGE